MNQTKSRVVRCLLRALAAAGGLLLAASSGHAAESSTLSGKLIMGYQGWFSCPDDGAGRGWFHWLNGDAPLVDLLPDVSELSETERCATAMKTQDGHPVALFSSQNPATVDRHFAWMEHYGLDGVALQRFATQLLNPKALQAMDHVLKNVRRAAEDHGRSLFIMYDLSGMPPDKLKLVVSDWDRLQADGLTDSSAYGRHRGHPVVGLWGLGFSGRPMTPADAQKLIAGLVQSSAAHGGVTILGGVPSAWRTGRADAAADAGWRDVWPKLAVISPWTVGRYHDAATADAYRTNNLEPDLKEARRIGADYMPVVFPGFSWANLMQTHHAKSAVNSIPRDCGRFYWRQVHNALAAGATMMYGAMFDEVDEGTAMFKLVPAAAAAPKSGMHAGATFVTLDADGCKLPSDWYLQLAGAAATALHQHKTPPAELPLKPPS